MSIVDALRRHRQALELHFPNASVDQLRSVCREHHRSYRYGRLRAEVTPGGELHARVLSGGRLRTGPYFRGRVRSTGARGVVVRGSVLESRNEVFATHVFVALPLLCWLGVVALVVAGVFVHPATVIAVIAAVAFTVIGVLLVRQRLVDDCWTEDVKELTSALRRELGARP
ncbi:hypothetical protein [Nocardioides zeicaulis]|uniref:DUF3040 domain-containing protein n=1 Tax=Nocardioides zeicaulis TaxID=1776857 RepID=A0ABV6E7X4_9ACTN